jgi:hypothetical protein
VSRKTSDWAVAAGFRGKRENKVRRYKSLNSETVAETERQGDQCFYTSIINHESEPIVSHNNTKKLRGLSPRGPLVSEVNANFFADRECNVVSVTDPYGRILDFLDRSRYIFFPVVPQLYSRG